MATPGRALEDEDIPPVYGVSSGRNAPGHGAPQRGYTGFVPIYEYNCRECGTRFEVIVRGQTTPECPGCHGTSLERAFSTFAVSSNGRAAAQSAPGPCGTCGDPRGPGACSMN